MRLPGEWFVAGLGGVGDPPAKESDKKTLGVRFMTFG